MAKEKGSNPADHPAPTDPGRETPSAPAIDAERPDTPRVATPQAIDQTPGSTRREHVLLGEADETAAHRGDAVIGVAGGDRQGVGGLWRREAALHADGQLERRERL